MSTSIEILGMQGSLTAFLRLEDKLTRLRPLLEIFGEEFYAEEGRLFARQPWKPLSAAYAKRKQEKFGDKPILRATDTLYRSLTEKGAAGNIHRVTDSEADYGSVVPYGVFHVDTRNPMAEPDEERYGTLAGEYVTEMVKEAGFN